MSSYEQLGLFYLGRRCERGSGERLSEPLLYDSRDLLTHAVCVGMTGSGKTGLGIALIEEAALDGIPVLAIDPKGDLANLLLTFPALSPADFKPWIAASPPGGAESLDERAAREAARWQAGLAEWDQPPERIARLEQAAAVRVYTPGSRAGTTLAVLGALGAPASPRDEDNAAAVATAASGLLTLAGIEDAAPHSREHALVSAILSSAGQTRADLPWLVAQIQRPSFERVGVLDLETFYPARDRQTLALRFNSVLASPGFGVWLEGEPLDIAAMLYDGSGRPRVAVVSIAHLGDAERMLVVSMLLQAALDWTRRQSGTTSLRAMVYMDEVFGYLPPVANPPSKAPLLTMLKQARAFGVGVVLATQNPVDLDYKALSNAGTWFLGRLQTERDKARVLDGVESLSSSMTRSELDRLLTALRPRVFLMHNVHDREPSLFETRWTMSYLRGPMTRDDIERALARRHDAEGEKDQARPAPAPDAVAARDRGPASMPPAAGSGGAVRPVLPAGVVEAFLPAAGSGRLHTPALYGAARVHYRDARRQIAHTIDVQAIAALRDGPVTLDWNTAEETSITPEQLLDAPPTHGGGDAAGYAPVPAPALQPRSYKEWTRAFSSWVQRHHTLRLMHAPSLKLTSLPGESERDFRIRLLQAAHEARDEAVEKLRARYRARVERLTAKVRSAEDAIAREQEQARHQKLQSAVSIGATMLGALLGRKAISTSTLGRATTAARGVGRTVKEAQDVARAEQRLAEAKQELAALEQELEAEIAAVPSPGSDVALETLEIPPARGGVEVRTVVLVWRRE